MYGTGDPGVKVAVRERALGGLDFLVYGVVYVDGREAGLLWCVSAAPVAVFRLYLEPGGAARAVEALLGSLGPVVGLEAVVDAALEAPDDSYVAVVAVVDGAERRSLVRYVGVLPR